MDATTVQLIQEIIITFPAFLLALVVHEYSHAAMATFFGDQTAAWSGRLTLNPLVHIDPVGTILLPLIGMWFQVPMFGWAKPVPIDPRQFRNYRRGLFWVAFAGPLSNILFGFVSTLVFVAVEKYVPGTMAYRAGMLELLRSLVLINFMLAVFNLLPVPPMDGSNIVLSFLSYNATRVFYQIQQYAGLLMLLLLFSRAFQILVIPVIFLANLSETVARLVFGLA
jgi:Zn-dependent protease